MLFFVTRRKEEEMGQMSVWFGSGKLGVVLRSSFSEAGDGVHC